MFQTFRLEYISSVKPISIKKDLPSKADSTTQTILVFENLMIDNVEFWMHGLENRLKILTKNQKGNLID